VTASTQLGDGTSIGKPIYLRIVDTTKVDLWFADTNGAKVTNIQMDTCAAKIFSYYIGTPGNFPPTFGTTVTLTSLAPDLAVSVVAGSPVLDQLGGNAWNPPSPSRAPLDISLDMSASGTTCNPLGIPGAGTATFRMTYNAGGVQQVRVVNVSYPK
jgi:hypothetical protein